jgi:ribosomal protein S12 methylthiotransferase
MSLQGEMSLEFNRSRVGGEVEVMVDAVSGDTLVCRSEFESPEVDGEILLRYDPAVFDGIEPNSLVGSFLQVRIVSADEYDLRAELVRL